ncbi:MAG TPA: protein kinase [Candidatus Eisenbacteria bacterium]|jgi:serine/threonine-protein kinase
MIGTRFSHYEIIREIGGGGMGVVYLARDHHLGCEVAVKVLPPGTLADEAARKRFRREAHLLAKRNHPNIVVAHDFDTEGGVDFLVMEYVPGVTLRERLLAGPLPEPEILDLGKQLLRAIAAAHEADVIHQDLKPGNLKITPDGVLKVLDFGLARHHPSVDETTTTATITETGAIVGTLPYMAPEQLLGKPADRRSDLYSVGVILYEMATGRLPHEGGVPAALIGEILHGDPPPPSSRNPAISAGLESSILRALEKGPDLRFQSARDFERDLKKTPTTAQPPWHIPWGWTLPLAAISIASLLLALESGWLHRPWGVGTRGVTESIAVLPLLNLSNDAEQDYFADGMTEELITKLAQIRDLNVISRTSVMQFKGKKTPLPEIARRLHVRTVLNGSVERVGSRVRIQAQLVDAVHDHHLWAESYVGNLSDILGLQTEVARAISNEVRVKLSPGEEARLAQVRPVDPAAHEAYLRGLYLWNGREPRDLERAIEQYKKAAALDPGYALPHVGLADAYDFLGNYSRIPQSIAHEKAKEEALRALAIDSTLGEAHASLAELKTEYEWDWVEAEREFRRAIELNPGYATAHQWYAEYLSRMGRHQEALAQIERALALDPLSPPVNGMLATVYFHGRQTDKAIELYRVALDMRPDVLTRLYLGLAYLEKKMYPQAIAELQRAVAGSGDVPLPKAILGCAYGMAGRRTEARKILARLEAQAGEGTVPPSCMAFVWIGLGNKDQAFHWLEEAYAAHDSYLGHLKVAPIVDGLRSDPRFIDLLRRVGLESPGSAS